MSQEKGTSNKDVSEISGISLDRIMEYKDLLNYKNIEELLPLSKDAVIILYLQKKNYGHWCGLIRNNKTIEFFDPYGIMPDTELTWLKNKKFRIDNYQNYPYLTYLLEDATNRGYTIEYNDHKFQGPDVSTCGNHVGIRLRFSNLNLDTYIDFIKKLSNIFNISNTDKLIVFLSNLFL